MFRIIVFIVALIGVSLAEPSVSTSRRKCDEFYPSGEFVKFDEPSEKGHEEAETDEFPYMVAIGYEKEDGTFVNTCGGVLIDPKYILCPAYCVRPAHIKMQAIYVYVGKNDLSNPGALSGRIKANRTIIHPDWKGKHYNQIALIELEKSVSERPICLQEEDRDESFPTLLTFEPESKKLWKTPTKLVSRDVCAEFYSSLKNGISERQLCAKEANKDDFRLASSGPLILQKMLGKSFIPYVIGMSSIGVSGGFAPSVYEKIPAYVSWIESTIWPNA